VARNRVQVGNVKHRYTFLGWVTSSAVMAALRLSSVDAAECEQLKALQLAHTEITLAEVVKAGAFRLPEAGGAGGPSSQSSEYSRLPSFCRVAGTIRPTSDSDIRFEVWMPSSNGARAWNGKFVGVGNGAWAGSITHAAMIEPLSMGYATAVTDGGHQGDPMDASFAANHPGKLADFGHRALHETTVAAKAVIDAFYGRKADRSLFVSCSTGGRQGLMEAHRYPEDYDGISAMAPANPVVGLMVSSLWTGHAAMRDAASRLPPATLGLVHIAAVEACDAGDGVRDGIISAPARCRFDPAALQCKGVDGGAGTAECLTAPQVAAMRAIYQGPRNPRTNKPIFPGFEPGSEAMLQVQTAGTEPFPAVSSYFRNLVFKDPKWDFRTFDYDKDVTRAMQAHSVTVDVPPTGLDNYFAGGRKLLLSQGWADPLIPPGSTVNFYEDLNAHLGEKKASGARLFMIPGMGHCAGGDGPFVFDAIATIDKWVETGRAPERIVVSNPPDMPARTRPICPYPQEAVYSGAGSTDDEKHFRCSAAR
jgi:feruloyl esterase